MQALLDVILPVFFVVGLGYAVVWRKVFSTVAVDGLMTYTQNFAIPCLLFMALIKIDLGQAYSFRLMGSYYIGAASGFALGFLGARYIFKRSHIYPFFQQQIEQAVDIVLYRIDFLQFHVER